MISPATTEGGSARRSLLLSSLPGGIGSVSGSLSGLGVASLDLPNNSNETRDLRVYALGTLQDQTPVPLACAVAAAASIQPA